jgi:hypothetical protein
MLRSDSEMLAGAGGYIPEGAGKRSKYMQGRGGEASYVVATRVSSFRTLCDSH